jgi:GT2 family glycosyltransferase
VIPAHGPGPYLAEAIASALAEAPVDVLVVEDGTEGVDGGVLRDARLLRLPHVRRSRARNAGVESAATLYVAFLDEDDACLPGRLARQRAALEEAPSAALTFGRVTVVDGDGRTIPDEAMAAKFDRLVAGAASYETVAELGGPLYTSATMVRRERFLAAGGFDPSLDAYEDLDLYLRLARDGGLVPTPGGPVSAYRVHASNTHSDDLYEAALRVAAKHLPDASGRGRRALLERRVDALWGLGRFAAARREALAAAAAEPQLLGHPRFLKRLVGLAAPVRLLEARR